jgi:hypothetical protein
MKTRHRFWFLVLLGGCAPPSFDPSSLVNSVRVLAVESDAPYAAPGQTVTSEALVVDGRREQAAPLEVFWLPEPCLNPPDDAYYRCFPGLRARFRPGADIESALSAGTRFSFQMPEDAIVPHPRSDTPYGLAVLFTIACAGQVRYEPPPPGSSPDAVPFACFDAAGERLGNDAFVLVYSLVYSFTDRQNHNPELTQLTFGGVAVDPAGGITVPHCTKSKESDCPATELDVVVPAASQEPDPSNRDAAGATLKEQLTVQYFATAGAIQNDVTIVFDPRQGRLSDTGDEYRAPRAAGEYRLWAVLRDNRGGTSSLEIPLHVQ